MFLPRKPALLLVLKEKAKRFMQYYDCKYMTRRMCNSVIEKAVLAAYLPSNADLQAIYQEENIVNSYKINRVNQHFSSGLALESVGGRNGSAKRLFALIKSNSKYVIGGTGLYLIWQSRSVIQEHACMRLDSLNGVIRSMCMRAASVTN